jgi:hypothetical protein
MFTILNLQKWLMRDLWIYMIIFVRNLTFRKLSPSNRKLNIDPRGGHLVYNPQKISETN